MTREEFEEMRNHVDGLEDIPADEAFKMMEEAECQFANEMAEQFDENGDPYRDFWGNPW